MFWLFSQQKNSYKTSKYVGEYQRGRIQSRDIYKAESLESLPALRDGHSDQ